MLLVLLAACAAAVTMSRTASRAVRCRAALVAGAALLASVATGGPR